MSLNFETYIPKHPLLKQHIAYFYFDRSDDPAFKKKYSFFPHINTTLSFYKNVSLSVKSGNYHISHNEQNSLTRLLTRQHSIQTVVQNGLLDKIGIVFYPLGLNHFITEVYAFIAKEEKQEFRPGNADVWDRYINDCFSDPVATTRAGILEGLLLSLYRPKEYRELYAVMAELKDPDKIISIRDIANNNNINHRKLNRDFKKELGISPELFRMIARFRHAVNQKILENSHNNLTEMAYESGYSDQSYMIRVFKKFTGLTPSGFFKQGLHLGMADTFWKFHDNEPVA